MNKFIALFGIIFVIAAIFGGTFLIHDNFPGLDSFTSLHSVHAQFGGSDGSTGGSGGQGGNGCCGGGNPNGNGGNGGNGGNNNTPQKTCDIYVSVSKGNGGSSDVYVPCPKTDVCPNISGNQASVPDGYVLSNGQCVIDQCPNISGVQTSIPDGKVKDSSGNCVVDQCPNLSGIQTSVPNGYVIINGQCVIDQCPNLSGVQTSVPSGYVVSNGQCVIDQCPNLSGVQTSVPSGYVVNNGQCVIDQCPNLSGVQESVPSGYVVNNGQCVIDTCPNISGVQTSVPDGYVLSGGQCVIDKCPNISGVQTSIPDGYVVDAGGQCVIDQCTNIDGIQTSVPSGYTRDSYGKCTIITQCVPPTLTSPKSADGTVGVPFSYTVVITGTQPISIKFENLPAGLTSSGNTISGTPTKAGTFQVGITLDNKCGNVCTYITIKIVDNKCPIDPPKVASNPDQSGKVGEAFSYEIQVTNDPTEVTATGLPDGLTINKNTGVISGTPTQEGTFTVSFSAKNECGKDDGHFKIVITKVVDQCPLPVPHITSGTSASLTLNQPFSYTLTTSGNPSSVNVTNLPSWLTYDANTGIISGTPTAVGTYTVNFAVSNQCGNDHSTLTIVVTGNGGSCTLTAPTITSGNDIQVTRGQQVSYTITTSGTVTSVSVDNLPSWLNYSSGSQVVFGTAPASGDYTFTVKAANDCALTQITVTIHVIGEPGCSANCGGGGFFAPTVVLLQHATTSNPLASYASVYLSQVPYTGAGDVATTLAFLLGLLVVSIGIAYVIVYRRELTHRIFGKAVEPSFSVVAAPVGAFETPVFGGGLPDHPAPAYGTSHEIIDDVSVYETMPKKKEETTDEDAGSIKTFYSSDFGASISEGLAAIKQNLEKRDALQAVPVAEVPASPNVEAMGATLEEAARTQNAMLSKDGVDLILTAADNKIENALRILNQMIAVAAEWYPAGESAYLILDANRVRSILFSTYVSMVPLFIRWISENDHAKVFNFLRMINHQGHAVSDFVKAVAYELDKVYRFRTEHDAGADEYSVQVTTNWKKETIEKVVTTLVGGFDDNYSSSLTAAKLAFSKVLDMVRTQNIPAVEQYRLAEGN